LMTRAMREKITFANQSVLNFVLHYITTEMRWDG
jgi:hypothetical protein